MNTTIPNMPPSRSGAVSGLAWSFIGFSALTVALLTLPLLPGEALVASLGVEAGSGGLTGGVAWLIERSNTVAGLLMVGAAVTLVLSVALLQRRRWARPSFIGLMSAGFVGVLGGAALTPLTFGFMADAAGNATSPDDPVAGLIGALAVLILFATLLVVLFAWAIWKLTTPAVRAEFERTPVAAVG
ncbi:MAG: hypothetical protein LPK20_05400 [Halomonas sp.]|jgi:hypothetical protein|uniref:Uncharacterized protein n=1 Tax=Billgrantia tianxiuensis TaxID=2497861 RepID=A0A6I6SD21_9GAMM|nr:MULTISPECIES: hypothetical protein [Halomonas]MCE8034975.1 hypothetical protein [Halomonas sp. MCCC 1A11057]MDX5432985.1 hypothetical protein [Halomonas sp.]QHC48508.1 hypothetical protein EKK97_01330 [Halomonas tianxiuensis]